MTKTELVALIKETCGPVVADIVGEKMKTATNNAAPLITPGSPEDKAALVKTQKGLDFAGAFQCLARAGMDPEKAVAIARKEWAGMPGVEKALTAGSAVDGGFMIAPEQSDEIIDLLTPRTVVRRHVSNIVPLDSGTTTISRLTGSASVSWGGEVQKITKTQQAFGLLTLRARQEKTMVPISNTLLRRGGPRVANMIRQDTLRSMSIGEDAVLLRSPGTEHRPKGIRYWAVPGNVIPATATPDLDEVTADLGNLVLKLEEANVGFTAPFWVFAPRTKQALMTVRIPNGPYAFRDEMLTGKLWGFPFESTTQVPTNLDGGTSEILLADGDELAIGQGPQLQVALSEEGVIVEEDGSVISAFQQNMTLLRVISEVDLVARHAEAIAVLSGVTWAPGSIETA